MIIEEVCHRIVFDSRGNETVEAEVFTTSGYGSAIAPAGASVGKNEAVSADVTRLPEISKKIREELIGLDASDQEGIDSILREIDGTDNFSNIGGNFAIATSLAVAKSAANSLGIPLFTYIGGCFSSTLPYPLGNVIGGGAHAPGSTDIQEFLVIPVGAETFFEAVKTNVLVHKTLKRLFSDNNLFSAKGDEGAWAVQITDDRAFEILQNAIDEVTDETGVEVRMGIDVAASTLWNGEEYVYRNARRNSEDQITYISELAERYNLLYIEDPLHEDDYDGFAELTSMVDCMVCGDDIFTTNTERIKKGIEVGAGNTVLIKPNQIGTLTDTFQAVKLARDNGYSVVISHRSGETTDDSISHLSVAFNSELIKTGVVGGERVAKLNELVRIEEMLESPEMVSLDRWLK